MSTMPTNDDKPLGGLGGIFSAQYLPAAMIAFTSGLKAMGLKGQGDALVTAAGRRQQAADFEAQQLEVNAGQAKAASQRDAFFKDLEGQQLISAIRARAGAGATDPTVLNIIGQAMARRSYNMQAALYGGDEKARLMNMQATAKRYDAALGMDDAKQGRDSYRFAALGALAEGGARSLYQKYWANKDMPGSGGGAPSKLSYDDAAFDNTMMMADGGQRVPTNTTGIRG
jgi:hypothetical protein